MQVSKYNSEMSEMLRRMLALTRLLSGAGSSVPDLCWSRYAGDFSAFVSGGAYNAPMDILQLAEGRETKRNVCWTSLLLQVPVAHLCIQRMCFD